MAVTPAAETKPWRLFVAIELPSEIREALRQPLDGLLQLRDFIRPSPIEQIHLTLHFLGAVEPTQVEGLSDTLDSVVRKHQAFELSVRGVDAFGGRQRPKVLWAGFAERNLDRLEALRAETGRALVALGREIDKDFRAHLTLGRARRPLPGAGRQMLRAWYAEWAEREFGTLPVRALHLMRSQLGGGPARHSSLASFELQ